MHIRRLALAPLLALALAACGSGSATSTSGSASSPASITTAVATIPAAAPGTPTDTAPDRPAAPDFSLALGDGGTFRLSEEARPVYLVFWAEW